MQPKTTAQLLEAIRAKFSIRSDYALMKFMGVTQGSVIRWKSGGCFNDEHAVEVARLLELPPAYVLACVNLERAKGSRAAGVWRQIADAFAAPVMLWLIALSLSFSLFLSHPVYAGTAVSAVNNIHYAKFKTRRRSQKRQMHRFRPRRGVLRRTATRRTLSA